MKIKLKKEVNLHELSFLFEDAIKSTSSIQEKHTYHKLYLFIQEHYNENYIQNFRDIAQKKYILLLQNQEPKNNTNQEHFSNYVYTKYSNNILNDKFYPEINIGTIFFESITLCPSLNWKYLHIKNKLFYLKEEPLDIYNVWDNKLLTTKINNQNDYIKILSYINFYKRLELNFINKTIDFSQINTNFEFSDKTLLPSYAFNINNISYIQIDPIAYKYKLITIKNEHFLNIIYNNFPTNIIKTFEKKYNIFKNFQKALPDNFYQKLLILYEQEKTFIKQFIENKCEHYHLLKNNKINEIIDLYLDKETKTSLDEKYLQNHNHFFQCQKCKFNLICPHHVFKSLYKNKNLNAFIEYFENKENIAFCKICGEKLYETSYNIDKEKKSDLHLTFEGIDEPSDILKKNIYIELSVINKSIITKNKFIYDNDIYAFVYEHIYDQLFNVISIIHKDKTTSNYIKSIRFQLLIYIYCICSVSIIATQFSNYIKIFNLKTTQINKLIPLIYNEISQRKSIIINKLDYTKTNIENLVTEIINKLITHLPKFISLKDININTFILNDIKENTFYNYIFLINKILYGKNFDIEIVLDTNVNDLTINKNNIFFPNYDFLKTKTGGEKKHMTPLYTIIDISNLSKKLIKDFTNDKNANTYFISNPLFQNLKQNIDNINISLYHPFNSVLAISNNNIKNNDVFIMERPLSYIFYNKPNYEIDKEIYANINLTYLDKIKYAFITNESIKTKDTKNITIDSKITTKHASIGYNYKNSNFISKIAKDLNMIKYNTDTEELPTYLKKIQYHDINISQIMHSYNIDTILENISKITQLKEYYKYITNYITEINELFNPIKDLISLFKLINMTSSEEGISSKTSPKEIAVEDEISFQVDMDNPMDSPDVWDQDDDTNVKMNEA